MTITRIDRLAELYNAYDVIFCDVWGVLHNGVEVFTSAGQALRDARCAGKCVIMLTNSPRTHSDVLNQLDALGVDRVCYDGVVTSGDATRQLLSEAPRRLLLIGPNYDAALFEGLDIELVEEFEADGVIVTGLVDDEKESPEDYRKLLERLCIRNLPLICANPDLEVERGDKRLWCAGALARDYALLGGRVAIAGKPHYPIYELARKKAQDMLAYNLDSRRILAIGDGILTDVKGAQLNSLDVLYIGGGIHARHYAQDGMVDAGQLDAFFSQHAMTPTYMMMELA